MYLQKTFPGSAFLPVGKNQAVARIEHSIPSRASLVTHLFIICSCKVALCSMRCCTRCSSFCWLCAASAALMNCCKFRAHRSGSIRGHPTWHWRTIAIQQCAVCIKASSCGCGRDSSLLACGPDCECYIQGLSIKRCQKVSDLAVAAVASNGKLQRLIVEHCAHHRQAVTRCPSESLQASPHSPASMSAFHNAFQLS